MVKLCKKCYEENNCGILSSTYSFCYYGYYHNVIAECYECAFEKCEHRKDNGDYSLVDVGISDEDFNTIVRTSDDKSFIDAMIELKTKDPIEYQLKMSQFKASLAQVQEHQKSQTEEDNKVHCPKCNSTNIQIVPRKWSLLTGIFTNKTDRVCVNCKYKW